ncbi:MAG: Matrixin [Pedosphaera sp.]|nr:Matrixin [Pedosphaera sp.]
MNISFPNPKSLTASLVLAGSFLGFQATAAEPFEFNHYLVIPVRVHLLQAAEPQLATTLTAADIHRVFTKANKVWAQAGVALALDSLITEPAAQPEVFDKNKDSRQLEWLLQLRPEHSRPTNFFHVYYVKTMPPNGVYFPGGIFVKDTASLRKVEGGIDEPLPRVTSHEFGHALGLPHRQNVTNLMASGTTGLSLSDDEIRTARKTAGTYPSVILAPALLQRADLLNKNGKVAEAKSIYSMLAAIPLDVPETRHARKQSAPTQR